MTTRAGQASASRNPSQQKRALTLVACGECARSKVKCDGARPVCARCVARGSACEWAANAGEPRTAALKRKHSSLLLQSADEHDVLDLLRNASGEDASRLLQHLRSGGSVRSAIELGATLSAADAEGQGSNVQKRGALTSPTANSGLLTKKNRSTKEVSSSHIWRSYQHPSYATYSLCGDALGSPETAGRVLPPIRALGLLEQNPSGFTTDTMLRKSPSAPELSPGRQSLPTDFGQTHSIDLLDDLEAIHAADCNVTYADDESFRGILRSYFTWDHPYQRFFDEEAFLRGLKKTSSELASDLLTNAVVMYGARNYCHAHPNLDDTIAASAFRETQNLWEQDCSTEGNLASAIAGLIIFQYHAVGGMDKLAVSYILRTQHIVKRLGLYRNDISHRVYSTERPDQIRSRSIAAWGLYAYLSYIELAQRQGYSLPSPPPVSLTHTKSGRRHAVWTPASVRRPKCPALVDEIFAARCRLYLVINEIPALQSRFEGENSSNAYMTAAHELYVKLSENWDLRDSALEITRLSSPQLILLHCTYYHAVLELLRPFVPRHCGLDPRLCSPAMGSLHLQIVRICSNSAFQLRRLLRRHEDVFEDFPIDINFAAAITAVAFDSISIFTIHDRNFVGEATHGFLAALKMMKRMERAFHVMHFALQGIKHTLSANRLSLPANIAHILTASKQDTGSNGAMAIEQPKANWVFDIHRKDTDMEGARLAAVIQDMDGLDLGPT